MTFGEKLRRVRRGMVDMTQATLGELVGMGPETISKIETGRVNPTGDEIARLKAALRWGADTDEALALLAGKEAQ